MELKQYQEAYEKLKAGRRGEPSWLRSLRAGAMTSFAEKGFQAPKHDTWRYTGLASLCDTPFVFESEPFQPRSLKWSQEGVQVLDFTEALRAFPELMEKHLGRYADPIKNPFTALNAALFQGGVFIRVDDGVVVKEPIRVVHSAASEGKGVAYQPRTLILMGKGSQAAVVEIYKMENDANASVCHPRVPASGRSAIQASPAGFPPEACGNDIEGREPVYFTNAVAEIVLEEGAQMEYCKIQKESSSAFHFAETHVAQHRGSSFVSFSLSTGGRLSRSGCRIALAEEGAACDLSGLYLGDNEQVLGQQTFVDHMKPDGKSRQFFKGLMAGNSRGVFRGHVMVRQDAQRTDAQQTNKNLLLSDNAKVDTQPQLEILADDVKCSHGATVGQLQEDAIFYLRSRGIGEKAAGRILSQGFAREAIEHSSLTFMKEALWELVNEKLEKLFGTEYGDRRTAPAV